MDEMGKIYDQMTEKDPFRHQYDYLPKDMGKSSVTVRSLPVGGFQRLYGVSFAPLGFRREK